MTSQPQTPCPFCDATCHLITHTESVRHGRKVLKVEGLKKWVCPSCGGEHEDENLSSLNLERVNALSAERRGAITPGLLRQFRRQWGLNQVTASKLFGAGASSFAKWESGQSQISQPAALLIQTAFHVPQALAFLAQLAQVPLIPQKGTTPEAPQKRRPESSRVRSSHTEPTHLRP